MTETVVARARQNLRRWRADPVAFVREVFGVEPDPWQARALRVFGDPSIRRVSLQACVGPGKTAVLAWCAWNFLACYGDRHNHPKGAAVAVTWDNLKDNLWSELAKWQQRSAVLSEQFLWTAERVVARDHPQTWWLSARAWPRTASPDEQGKTLSGLHSAYILALIDESGTVPSTVLRAAEQALSTGPRFGKIVQAGNPITREGMLYAAASPLRSQWHVIRVTGDPDDPEAWVHAGRFAGQHTSAAGCACPACWARLQIDTYGRENPWVRAHILGEFPETAVNALLSVEDVESAMTRVVPASAYAWAQMRVGVDVARYGDDRTVLFPRQGLQAFPPVVMRHARDSAVSTDIAAAVLRLQAERRAEVVLMDATGGWAAGARDVLVASGHRPVGIQFHKPSGNPKYRNRRAEMWFRMAEWVKAGGALPKDARDLVGELTTPTYTFVGGAFLVEPKEQVKARLGRSPDLADALALTFALPDQPGQAQAADSGPKDPFSDWIATGSGANTHSWMR